MSQNYVKTLKEVIHNPPKGAKQKAIVEGK